MRTCSCESGILFTHLWQHFCGINVEYALEEMTREIPRSRHICLISHKPSNLMKNIYLCNQFFMSIALFQHVLKLIKNTIYGLEDWIFCSGTSTLLCLPWSCSSKQHSVPQLKGEHYLFNIFQ